MKSTKPKTSVRAKAKSANKSSTKPDRSGTDKARKAASAEVAARLEAAEGSATLAPDAAEAQPPKGKAKRGRAAHAGSSAIATKTGPAYAADGTLKTVSIPVDEPVRDGAEEPQTEPKPNGRKPPAAKEPKPKKVSGLDAAAMVLSEAGTPMKAIDMLAEIQKRGLWASKGKTPEATLYAAIIREIAAKGDTARFKKHDRGRFIARA